ncbi:MAG: hypothetical protein JWP85_2067 [Rhodoglobus sp.]|nr:hypothetical protein [Rhodoglobus sp.]
MTGAVALAPLTPRARALSVILVWLLTVAGAVVVGIATVGDDYFTWLPIVLAGAVVITFLLQLATRRTEGFVTRGMASIGGSIVILGLATGLLALLR